MARNGAGTYNLPAGQPVVTGTVISSTTFNTLTSDIATALTASIANDGQTVPVANLPMGGFKLTGLGDATVANDAIRYNGALGTPSSGTVTNLTGTASININGTVGSTTPTTGKFTTVTATGGINEARGSIAMHATTMDLWAQPNIIDGTSSAVTITAIANAPQAGARRVLYPVAASVITNGATFAVDGAANATAAAGDKWEFEAITTSTYKVHITKKDGTAVVAPTSLPRSYLAGFGLSNNGSDATNDIDIAVGSCRDSTNAADITLASALTKQLDAAWAVGTNQGGLDTGSIANTTYHIWAIKRSDTGVVDALFSTSATSPTMPTNYDYKRRIGSIVRTGAAIKAFTQDGDLFQWLSPVLDVDQSGMGTSAALSALTVPTGVNVVAIMNIVAFDGTGSCATYISDPTVNDDAPSYTAAPLYNCGDNASTGDAGHGTRLECRTNTSAQIRRRTLTGGGTSVLRISATGWIDSRGRNA